MFDFFAAAFNAVVNLITGTWQQAVTAIVNWVNQIEYAHYGYWHTVAGNVLNGWQQMTRGCLIALQGLQQFMFAQSLLDYVIMRQRIPWLANWIAWLGGKTVDDLRNAIDMLRREYRAGDDAEHGYTRSVLEWVLVHVLAYLLGRILDLVSWITGIGSTMWHYFTHLADFADLLFWFLVAALESRAWDVADKLGEFLLALIIRNLGRFARLLETIIDAVI